MKAFYFDAFMVGTNLLLLLLGIFADPGVPESVYLRWTKSRYAKSPETELQDTTATEDDVEAGTPTKEGPSKRGVKVPQEDPEDFWDEGKRPEDYPREDCSPWHMLHYVPPTSLRS